MENKKEHSDQGNGQGVSGSGQQFSSQQELVPNEQEVGAESDFSERDGASEEAATTTKEDKERRTSALGRIVGTLQVCSIIHTSV